jgi:predicted transcriptional regulator
MDYKKRIKELGLKKIWIANRLGISQVLFSYYITGSRPMPEHIERKLKEILK